MKILHIVPAYFPAVRYGGPIKSVHELNKWLVKNGVEVVVYTTNIDGSGVLNVPVNQAIDVDGVKVFYFPITFRSWQYSYLMQKALAKNIKDFDLIHITSVFLAASALGAYYAKKFRKPYIISPRGSLMIETLKKKSFKKNLYLNLIEKINLKNAIIHFTAEMEKQEYINCKLPLNDFIIIPNGVDLKESGKKIPQGFFRKKIKISNDKKIVLSLGRLSWKKGFDILIPAFAEVVKKESKAILVIAGGDDEYYKKTIDDFIEKYNIRDFVIFTGMIGGDDKIAAYRESDVFVLPSYSENFGIAVVEAMVAGKPVVITKGVGISKEIESAGAGLVVEKDVNQVAEAILKILENPQIAAEMGKQGHELVEKEFSIEKVAEKWIKEYNKIIKIYGI